MRLEESERALEEAKADFESLKERQASEIQAAHSDIENQKTAFEAERSECLVALDEREAKLLNQRQEVEEKIEQLSDLESRNHQLDTLSLDLEIRQ